MIDIYKADRDAAARVRAVLDRPDAPSRELQSCDHFDPWDILDAVYGSYDSNFDDCVIEVLQELADPSLARRRDLAAEMVREMLCVANLCDYESHLYDTTIVLT